MDDSDEHPALPDTLEEYYEDIVKTALVKIEISVLLTVNVSCEKNSLFC